MAILEDTQRFLHFNLTHTGADAEDNHYVDLGKLLSQANRRFYRQGMVYHIANIVFDDAEGDADIDVCTLPNTWYTQEAWKLGFEHWKQQRDAGYDSLDVRYGRWNDFKINLNADMETDADQAALIDVNGNTFPTGDWDKSRYYLGYSDGNPTEADVIMMGANAGSWPDYTQVSLLHEFQKMLSAPTEDPNLDADASKTAYGLMSSMTPDPIIVSKVVQDIEDRNDLPPYSAASIPGADNGAASSPGSPWVARTCMIKGGASTSSPVAAVGGFAAPCGLIMIETSAALASNSIGVTVELVPGEYKGVHAYPMRGGGF